MKRIIVKSKNSCWFLHEWRFQFSTRQISYYQCPYCISRMATIGSEIKGYQPVNHDWLNCAKRIGPMYDSWYFIRKVYMAMMTVAFSFILIGLVGLINDHFFHGGCNGRTERVVNGTCMVLTKNGAWASRESMED